MNFILIPFLLLFVIVFAMIAIVVLGLILPKKDCEHEYYRNDFNYDFKMIVLHRWILKQTLKIDFIAMPDVLGGKQKARIKETWTSEKTAALRELHDYHKIVGWKDSILWAGVPCYIRISNVSSFNTDVVDKAGRRIYSEDTGVTLNDKMTSNNILQFIKGLGKMMMSKMDLQTIILVALVGVGAIAALYFMGVI